MSHSRRVCLKKLSVHLRVSPHLNPAWQRAIAALKINTDDDVSVITAMTIAAFVEYPEIKDTFEASSAVLREHLRPFTSKIFAIAKADVFSASVEYQDLLENP